MDTTRDADIAALLPSWLDYAAAALPGAAYGAQRLRFETGAGLGAYNLVLAAFPDPGTEVADGFVRIRLQTDVNLESAQAEFSLRADQTDTHIADELLAAAKTRLAALGRKRMHADLPAPALSTAYASLYTQSAMFTALGSGLDLTAFDRRQFAEWAEPSAKNQDYRIVHWVDHCPDELAESYSRCLAALNDAPREGLETEHSKNSVARLREGEAVTTRYGARRYVTVAVSAQGEVAGFTQSVCLPDEPEHVDLWSTAVAREHRGHGIGLRIKAAATLEVVRDNPAALRILTFNNHGNEHMLAVNRQLGYRPVCRFEVHEFAC